MKKILNEGVFSDLISKISEKNIELVGEYLGNYTKTMFRHECGYEWETTPKIIRQNRGCKKCSLGMLDYDTINRRLLEMNSSIELIGEYKNMHSKTLFRHECGYEWLVKPAGVMNGTGCPKCSDTTLTSTEVLRRLLEMNSSIELIGEYKNNYTKTLFRHECGYEWLVKPSSVMGGVGCPNCALTGFNSKKPAWEYIFIRDGYLKYGITNNLANRLRTHRKYGEFTLVHEKYHTDGQLALDWENNIKKTYGGRFISKERCIDGYTETLSLNHLQALIG